MGARDTDTPIRKKMTVGDSQVEPESEEMTDMSVCLFFV